jgi:tetratricopeptide (TPR) repeat protein
MRICDRCFALLASDGLYCPECGASVDSSPSSEGSDALVYPDLARANLLRMKGQFQQAEQICLNILKRYPHNPTAHLLLGDIHADQGNWEQAANWYELAVDLTPENPTLKNKMKRAQEMLLSESKPAQDTIPASGTRWIYLWYGMVILVILTGVVFAVLYRQNQKAREPLAWENMAQKVSAAGAPNPPGALPKTSPGEPSQPSREPNPPSASSPPPEPSYPLTEMEKSLLALLRSEPAFGERIATVFYHVGDKWAVVTVSPPPSAPREALLQDAFAIAGRLLQVESSCLRADVRYVDPSAPRLLLWVALERAKYEQVQPNQPLVEILQIVYEERG